MRLNINKDVVTKLQAFKAMVTFLEHYYKRTSSDDIGSLLGDLQLLKDGGTADPAAWDEWQECINYFDDI